MLKPSLRALKYNWLGYSAKLKVNRIGQIDRNERNPIAFLLGCGRSGTTILGDMLSLHPQIEYLFEPYHLWAAIDRKTDVLNLYNHSEPSLLMNASMTDGDKYLRFWSLIGNRAKKKKLILEKTPLNAMRIGYLKALAPQGKFIHLVRDGVDVSHSINRLATKNNYKIAGKPLLNQWWGINNSKWLALARDGIAAQYFEEEVPCLKTNLQKGAYEWLVSLKEVEKWQPYLKKSLIELTYSSLIFEPISSLERICQFLGLDSPASWLARAKSKLEISQKSTCNSIILPSKMCEEFNLYQKKYSFSQKATTQNNYSNYTLQK